MKLFYNLLVLLIVLSLTNCARVGRPNGGGKDEKPPIMVMAKPHYKSINFNKNEIKLYFNEYVVLKDLKNELIISPPLKNPPVIYPQGTPSKYIKIKILDTLKQNTTYTFNFGNAIQDNNENNKLKNFKYVFSTGNLIDSLKIKGSVNDALNGKLKKNISVLLYKLNSTYNDSIPYKQKPDYVTNTLDSINFQFTNIKKGKYIIMALDETVKDYIFNPKTDKIGFLLDTINLPKDSIINKSISIFKEEHPFKLKKASEIFKGKIQFGFEGDKKNLNIKLLTSTPKNFKSFQQFEKDKDTLNYWFTPINEDFLQFIVSKKDTIKVNLRKKKIDSLQISLNIKNTLHLTDTLFLTTNNPIVNIDKSKFSLIDKDSTNVDYKLQQKELNKLAVIFNKTPKNNYNFRVLPKAITDLYKTTNDSLQYKFNTKTEEEYGSITLNIKNKTKHSLIIELLSNNEVIRTKYVKNSKKISFALLEPKEYSIKAVIDSNNNEKWDTGSLINKTQPEKIIHYKEKLKLRANWTIDNEFVVE